MDYLEWELERQREALGALLGGGSRDREALQKDGRETAVPSERPAGQAAYFSVPGGREAGSPAERAEDAPAEQRVLRRDGTIRREGITGGEPVPPVSAWEQVLAGEEDAPEWAGGSEGQPSEMPARPHREGTGPALSGASGPETGEAEAMADRAETRRGRESSGEGAGGAASEISTTGYRLAKRLPAWAPETGEAGYRAGGFSAAPAEEDRVRALSRAVQRDARRYDGGFTIY